MRRRLFENMTICGLVMAGACTAPAMSDIFDSLEDQVLHAPNSSEDGGGAFMMDIDGDWAVIARPDRVDIYRRVGTRWVYHEQISLPEDVGIIGDVDLSGELLAVSTPKQSLGNEAPEMDGAVHIYRRIETDDTENWSYHQRVDFGDEHGTKGRFGSKKAVALDGETLMVGKPQETSKSKKRDTHVFLLDNDGYFEYDHTIQDVGGEQLDISGRWGVALGAGLLRNAQGDWLSHKETANTPKGALDVQMGQTKNKGGFAVKNGLLWKQNVNGTWKQYAQLEDKDGTPVSGPSRIDGDCIIVGDSQWGDGAIGRALLFKRKANTNQWQHVETLNTSVADTQSQYGTTVAIGGDWCLTAGNDDLVLAHRRGSKSSAPHMRMTDLVDPSPAAYEEFGASVAISRTWAVVGIPGTGTVKNRGRGEFIWDNPDGSIAVYKRNGLGETQGIWAVPDWSSGTELTTASMVTSCRLGTQVAISNPTEGSPVIVASAVPRFPIGKGEVFVWLLDEDESWSASPIKILADDPDGNGEFLGNDMFGAAIALTGNSENVMIAVSSTYEEIEPSTEKSGAIDIFTASEDGFNNIARVSLPGETLHLGHSLSLMEQEGVFYLHAADESGQGAFCWTSDDGGSTWSQAPALSTDEENSSYLVDSASNGTGHIAMVVGDAPMSSRAIAGQKGGRYWVATGDVDGVSDYQVRLEERVLGSQAATAHGNPARDLYLQGVEYDVEAQLGHAIDVASDNGTPRLIVGAPGGDSTLGRVLVYEPWILDLSGHMNPMDILDLFELLENPYSLDADRYDITKDHRFNVEDFYEFMKDPEPAPAPKKSKRKRKRKRRR